MLSKLCLHETLQKPLKEEKKMEQMKDKMGVRKRKRTKGWKEKEEKK